MMTCPDEVMLSYWQEDKMRDKPGFEHLNEPLHVLVEAELPANIIDAQLVHAREILEELLRPVVRFQLFESRPFSK